MTLGNMIANCRKKMNMTQDQLAQKLEVSNQAVSKWESDQCCPDIQLLPRLADIFGITIDELFGREPKVQAQTVCSGLPWPNDGTLRAVLYAGHTLVGHGEAAKGITFTYEGPALNVQSAFAVSCNDVGGNVDAGGGVYCANVGGSVDAGGAVNCGNVGGSVDAGGMVTCGNVDGDVDAGGDVNCGHVGGDADAGRDINCGEVGGDVDAGCNVTCGDVSGDVDAGGNATCVEIGGDADAGDRVIIIKN